MPLFVVMFTLGVVLLQRQAQLPSSPVLWGGAFVALLLCTAAVRQRNARRLNWIVIAATGAVAGFVWAGGFARQAIHDTLDPGVQQQTLMVTGVVSGLPQHFEQAVRFVLWVEQAQCDGQPVSVPRKIQLSWRLPPDGAAAQAISRLAPGQRWQLAVRLKRAHGFVNPHGFDYEAWLLERGIRATGYVRATEENRLLDASVTGVMHRIDRLRDAIRQRFSTVLAGSAHEEMTGLLVALAVGDQQAVPDTQWEIFRRTAVIHLVSISGLHVSMMALLAGGIAGWLWRRSSRLMLRVSAQRVAVLSGLSVALMYGLLAGLSVPTQRSLLMLIVAALGLCSGRDIPRCHILLLALLVVLLFDPWAVLSAGFWLSFGAVGVILLMVGGRGTARARWREATRIQLAITLVMLPALLFLFNTFSIISPLANALAIPVVSFMITPLVLLAIVLPFAWLLQLAALLSAWMLAVLEALAAVPFALWHQASVPLWLLCAALFAAGWLLLPRGTPARLPACLILGALLLWQPQRPQSGAFRVAVLDVGQGLAVHIQTARHDMLYDAGPRYSEVSDAGQRVLLPYFAAQGVLRLNALVLSHADTDHSGGTQALLDGMTVETLYTGFPLPPLQRKVSSMPCVAGTAWRWDDVSFHVLYPTIEDLARSGSGNNLSCVLRIFSDYGSVLLIGDLLNAGERTLVKRYSSLYHQVVVAAHHGSRSSSSAALVAATRASHVVFSAGYLNSFGHPHPATVSRWEHSGARAWRTDRQGAIVFQFNDSALRVDAWRERARRYWYDSP